MVDVDQQQQDDAVAESTTAEVPEVQKPVDDDVDMEDSNGAESESKEAEAQKDQQADTEATTNAPTESKPTTGVKLEDLFDEMDSDDDEEFPTTKAATKKESSPDLLASQRYQARAVML